MDSSEGHNADPVNKVDPPGNLYDDLLVATEVETKVASISVLQATIALSLFATLILIRSSIRFRALVQNDVRRVAT